MIILSHITKIVCVISNCRLIYIRKYNYSRATPSAEQVLQKMRTNELSIYNMNELSIYNTRIFNYTNELSIYNTRVLNL